MKGEGAEVTTGCTAVYICGVMMAGSRREIGGEGNHTAVREVVTIR